MKELSDNELRVQLEKSQSQRIERREDFNSNTKTGIHQTICALANDLHVSEEPGFIFVGVSGSGAVTGLEICDELFQQLSDIKLDCRLEPMPDISVRKLTVGNSQVAVIIIEPSSRPPVRFKRTVWVRVGVTTHKAGREDVRKLTKKKYARDLGFDITPVYSAGLEDLSQLQFESEYLTKLMPAEKLAAIDSTYVVRLACCGFIERPDDPVPTLLGLLVLGKSPRDHIQGAFIQFLRIKGTNLGDEVLDAEDCQGSLIDQLNRADAKFEAHNFSAGDISSAPTHIITNTYPKEALQQILYNAVMHRDYDGTSAPVKIIWFDDRVEIISPGGYYGRINKDNIGKKGFVDYRNPNLAAAMKTLGFVQFIGRGIMIARKLLRLSKHPELEFEADNRFFRCIIRGRQE